MRRCAHRRVAMPKSAFTCLPSSLLTPKVVTGLTSNGWAMLSAFHHGEMAIGEMCLEVAKCLGTPIGTRTRNLVDVLQPQICSKAHQRSLSRQAGMGTLPWHVDLAHRPVPARYLVLGCLSVGEIQAGTEFIDREVFLPTKLVADARSEPFLIRNGEHSFYGSILEGREDFIRFDPACMQGATKDAQMLIDHLANTRTSPTYVHQWQPSDVLLIDNWRLVHRRANASKSLGRTLLRVSVMENA